ncbi:Small-conductance mechanosensitive channel [Gloeomargarita lithophora Alchichica-D10]|uniref:Small-conductance mechanosensitive channel n=1 Tax=Gloeomargarita lithophora Alchichica-D10 TaxID=1188229 RepID=A0A1J0AC31_9CYAN|nr:mechanosensitive ion channel family protein [Gloeomargarita lithophora]APB33494.1 Small-conductance mechanosensitive channel [Gloeomargarita lithophora Alchichica-D10]
MRLSALSRTLVLCLFTLTALLLMSQSTWGQFTIPQQQSQVVLPSNVTRYGNIEATDVVFDGKNLFTIASATVRDRNNANSLVPVEIRAELIEANLQRIVAPYTQNLLDSREPKVIISVSTLNNETVILGRTELQQQNITVLTVTELDSSYNGIPIPALAEEWRQIIQENLQQAISQRTPQALLRQISQALWILIIVLFMSLILFGLNQFFRRRKIDIQKQITALKNARKIAENPSPHLHGLHRQRVEFINYIKSHFSYEQRHKIVSLFSYILLWMQLAIWLAGVAYILSIFPQTRAISTKILRLPIVWLTMWFLTGLGSKLGDFLIDRLQQAWENYNWFDIGEITRKSLRISTNVETLRGVKTAVVYMIRISYIFSTLGVPVSSIFALGGLLALAISLGSQNVIKDIINGLLILWEDQFGIGDIIQIGEYTGMVESMSLRITQLRNPEGCLITIPNSSIIKVSNLTRLWSRVNFEILVDCQTDPTQALNVLKKVTQEFYADSQWRQSLLELPEVLGIDGAGHEGLLLRVWLKTQPGQQWLVSREFRRRVVEALEQAGIPLGRPHQVFDRSDPHYSLPE